MWHFCSAKSAKKKEKIQERALRIVTNKHITLKLIYFNRGQLQNQQAGNYKVIPLTVQCRLQAIV